MEDIIFLSINQTERRGGGGVRLSINFIDYKADYFAEIGSSPSPIKIYEMFNIYPKRVLVDFAEILLKVRNLSRAKICVSSL